MTTTTKPPNPTPHPAHALLSLAHPPSTAQTLFSTRVQPKPLILRPTSPPPSHHRARRRLERLRKQEYFQRKSKRKLGTLSAAEKRRAGVHDLPSNQAGGGECRYEVYKGLNRLWRGYVREVLGLGGRNPSARDRDEGRGEAKAKQISAQHHGAVLASLDFHGAELEVVRCGCVGRVGTKGVVVRDTKFTFVVVTERDVVRTIPKKDTIFRVEVPLPEDDGQDDDDAGHGVTSQATEQDGGAETPKSEKKKKKKNPLVFELHGNQFQVRPADRANKKFKWRKMDYL